VKNNKLKLLILINYKSPSLEQKPEKMKLGKFISKALLPIMMQLLNYKPLELSINKKNKEEMKKMLNSMNSSEYLKNKF